jgi:hypothetical protein
LSFTETEFRAAAMSIGLGAHWQDGLLDHIQAERKKNIDARLAGYIRWELANVKARDDTRLYDVAYNALEAVLDEMDAAEQVNDPELYPDVHGLVGYLRRAIAKTMGLL